MTLRIMDRRIHPYFLLNMLYAIAKENKIRSAFKNKSFN